MEQTVKRHPDRDAIVYPRKDQQWTYAEFDERVNRLANALADVGVEKGDRVATLLYNGSEMAVTVYACAKLGAVFTPLNYRLSSDEVQFIVEDAGARALLFEAETRDAVEGAKPDLSTVEDYVFVDEDTPDYASDFYELVDRGEPSAPDTDVAEDDAYAFIYTSGTTGRPKGVVHEHRSMVEHNLLCIAELDITRHDVGLTVLPMYHCAELHAMLFSRIARGATNVIHHDFDAPNALRAIEDHEISLLFAAPTVWNALAQGAKELDVDTSSLRVGLYGAAPMPEQVFEDCMEQLCEDYVQAYGMTEMGPCAVFQAPEDQLTKQGCAGLPALHHDVRVVEPDADPTEQVATGDIGEILFAGSTTMREYWNRPDATAESLREADGTTWYYTGDLGYLDEDGYLWVVDRKDDMIITGGENVYPTEVEDALFSHEGVAEAAVVGEPDDEWGERVAAYVVGDATADELDDYLTAGDALADFKRPREYYFVDELPKNPSGKIQKFKLRDD